MSDGLYILRKGAKTSRLQFYFCFHEVTGISLNLAATHMGVSYKKLIKLLIDRNMNKKDLQEEAALSPASITSWQRTRSLALPC